MTKFISLREWKSGIKDGNLPPVGNLRKQVNTEVKSINEEELTVDYIISTAGRDRDNDTIAVDGWDLANYKQNPVVLWCHDHHAPPVAKASNVIITESELLATAQFTPRDVSPFGFMIFRMYQEKFLRATSVGFKPIEWKYRSNDEEEGGYGVDFLKQELWEFSCVPVPSNPEALALARSKGIDLDPLKMWAEQVLDHWEESKGGVALPRKKVETLYHISAGIDPTPKPTVAKLSLAEQVELGRKNLDMIKGQELTIEIEENDPVIGSDTTDGILKSINTDLVTLINVQRARFDELEKLVKEVHPVKSKTVDQISTLLKSYHESTKTVLENTGSILATTLKDLPNDVKLNVEAKLIDFETAIATKIEAALEMHKASLLEAVAKQIEKQLETTLDRFRDFYTERLADTESRAEIRADRVTARLQDVQNLTLRMASKIDQAIEANPEKGLENIGTQIDLLGESFREFLDVLSAGKENETTIVELKDDGQNDNHLEFDIEDEGSVQSSVSAAVGSSLNHLLRSAVNERIREIRGRLD